MLGGHLNLRMIGYGVLAGALLIAVDALLGRAGRMRLPPLAIGLGIYLPMGATLPVVIGAVAGYYYDRWADRGPQPAYAQAHGRADGDGHDRRRELVRCAVCRHRRGIRPERALRPGGR